ncbi:MAG: UDP-N-acetylglucosamine--N-acetylmuramyl-(pentapeptide) pyrophosphoryl-undecaprenol N-acetylglucosamine transferase [Brevinema sp.]
MRIIIGGGGTGGHLVPGIALSQEFKAQGHELRYVLREQDLSYDITNFLTEEEKITVSLSGMSRKISFRSIGNIFSLFIEWIKVFKQIKAFKPEVMIVTGGYVSNIVALSAILMRKPFYILEQNSAAGVTNRFWSKFALKVFTTFPFPKFIPEKKIYYTGNPLLYKEILTVDQAKEIFELPKNDKKIIGISGGSQGAKFINDMVLEILPELVENGYQIVWSLGTREYNRLMAKDKLNFLKEDPYAENVRVYRFISRMDAFWSGAELVVARAGAGTVSEALFFKTPTLFIPIHNSPDNHQYLNAKFLADKHCACILEEPILSDEKLLSTILIMLENQEQISCHCPTSEEEPAKVIVDYIVKTIS